MNLGYPAEATSASYQDDPAGVDASHSTSFAPGRVIAEASDDHIMFENSVSISLYREDNKDSLD